MEFKYNGKEIGIGIIVSVVFIYIISALALIWGINTLFPMAEIEYSFKTIVAAAAVIFAFR